MANFTPIPTGEAIDATSELFNERYQELSDAIDALGGTNPFNTLRFGLGATLTISGGAITPTHIMHVIDGEGGAADTLTTVNGGSDGQLLILRIANAARPITFQAAGSSFSLPLGVDRVVSQTGEDVLLRYNTALAKWIELNPRGVTVQTNLAPTPVGVSALTLPDRSLIGTGTQRRLAVDPAPDAANSFRVRSAAATLNALGIATPTIANTPTANNDADGVWIAMPSTAVAGNNGGFVSATFNLLRRQYSPSFFARVKTAADISNLRFWIGLISADVTNVFTLAGATEFAGFRFATDAPDTGWRPVTKDASTQNVGANIGTVAINTTYDLRCRLDHDAGLAYFSVNGGAEVSLSANLPQATTELGIVMRVTATTAAIRSILFSQMAVEMRP